MNALLFVIAVFGVVLGAWLLGLDAIRDPGGYRDRDTWGLPAARPGESLWRRIVRWHFLGHIAGAALTMLVGVYLFHVVLSTAALTTFLGWTAVEVAQWHPRVPYAHGGNGKFSVLDLVADALGIGLAWLLVLAIHA